MRAKSKGFLSPNYDSGLPLFSDEFIEENQRMFQILHNGNKKGGPYDKKSRFLRRQEVYKLHFERGFPAIKIADFMKICRNTINNDIRFWYSVLANDWKNEDIYAHVMKQLHRLEMQRTRLLDNLDKEENLSQKLSIEKLVFEIDDKISQILIKVEHKDETIKKEAHNLFNSWAEAHKLDFRAIDRWEIIKLSAKKHDKIMRIIKNE